MRIVLSAAFVGASIAATPCAAAILRPFSQITAGTVRLADLFDDLGNTPDRVLGAAPTPGARITIGSPQLAAIARDFNVAWRPASGAEQAVVERRGDVLSRAAILLALRRSLDDVGAPAGADIATPDLQPVVIPAGLSVAPEISQLTYDAQSGHFTALLSVAASGMADKQMRLSGEVVAMAEVAVAARRLSPGTVLGADDVIMARVRVASLHNAAPIPPEAARGMSVRHDLAAGQVLTAAALMRPSLVTRGATVRMTLNSDGIALSAQGIAVEAGARGDRIRVENPVSHQIIQAEVTGDNEVRVAPRGAVINLVSAQ